MNTAPAVERRRSPHPRRPPAHKSVSLRHSPQAKLRHQPLTIQNFPTGPASDKTNPPSSVSPAFGNKQSSGESSDAGKWFENTNKNAEQGNASFVDNDPPFLLQNSSSSDTPPDRRDPRSIPLPAQATSMPYRPGLTRFGTDGSSAEEFRSVIDDLTVANKRLKQKLRKYEKLYDAHLQDEKLFEVRFHGLPDHKKKELEETLQKFALSLDGSGKVETESPPVNYTPPLKYQPASSHTSRFAESGYASMSTSGQNSSSVAQSGQSNRQESNSRMQNSKSAYNRQQQNVQSYLHDIPAGLLPRSNAPMTEKSKKKLVVRRLEQIFAGKRSAPGSHPQPLQQQEVANSAARADRQAKQAGGQRVRKEGMREAKIHPSQNTDDETILNAPEDVKHKMLTVANLIYHNDSGSGSPSQRPTRPLDLDPYRAQIPAENMEYIRHLGFTPPDMASGTPHLDGHGWIYLNLLINMAQLHTINVTPDFVKDAVTAYSDKFELSHDGRKIRWQGGHDTTRSTSNSTSDQLSRGTRSDAGKSPNKRLKTDHSCSGSSRSADPERQARRMAKALKQQNQNKFAYTPLFFHKDDSGDEDDFFHTELVSSSNSVFKERRGDSSGLESSAMMSGSLSKRRKEDGPIIFYNKARFCTDLSGDQRGLSMANPAAYNSITTHPIGASNDGSNIDRTSEGKGPLQDVDPAAIHPDAMDLDEATSSSEGLNFSPEELQNAKADESPEAIEFEVSGLGGVQPEDNFAINVNRLQQTVAEQAGQKSTSPRYKHYPSKIMNLLSSESSESNGRPTISSRQHSREAVTSEIISTSKKYLPNSVLPPASFLPFDSTSSGDVDSDLESDAESESEDVSEEEMNRTPALKLLNISPTHITKPYSAAAPHRSAKDVDMDSSCDDDEDEETGDSDDDSVDFLATARAVNPEAVRSFEREYDANHAEKLAEEIPAGSSAATAGGGSGFNSPAGCVVQNMGDDGEGKGSSRGGMEKVGLKRARTGESLGTVLQQQGGKSQKVN